MQQVAPDEPGYRAFICYSRADEPFARRLQARLERYRIPRPFRPDGRRHLRPVFRDVDDLAAGGRLGDELRRALDRSRKLVVVASPAAAASPWVREEIEHFRRRRSLDDCIVVVVAGEPGGPPGRDPLPAALGGRPGDEPLWLDARGRRRLRSRDHVRLVASLLGVGFDRLWRRDGRRRRQRLVAAAVAAAVAAVAVGTAIEAQRRATTRAEPAHQVAAFLAFLEDGLVGLPGHDGEPLTRADLAVEIVRTDDVNGDSRLDFFVFNETDGFCGSGGCAMELWTSRPDADGHDQALDLFGHSEPLVKATTTRGYRDLAATFHVSGGEPVHSVFRWTGARYELSHYELCTGFVEYCDPVVFRVVDREAPPGLVAEPVLHRAPDLASPTLTPSVDTPAEVIGRDGAGEWFLVTWWKGESGFVHRTDVVGVDAASAAAP